MPKEARIILKLEGGMLYTVKNETAVQVVLIDYDTDGVPEEELCRCCLEGAFEPHIHRVMERG